MLMQMMRVSSKQKKNSFKIDQNADGVNETVSETATIGSIGFKRS